MDMIPRGAAAHAHRFLGKHHARNERRTWAVIVLTSAMMVVEIAGGAVFGSLALIADGLHMSTHAGAMLLAALAFTYARRHVEDPRFSFGTGKLGDLAGYSSAIVLAMIALLIGYEAVERLLAPVPIHFAEAMAIAALGLGVNVASAWLLGADHEGHHHGHDHDHGHGHDHRHDHDHASSRTDRDHAMRSAFVHVLADAAVSVLVIVGLGLAWGFGWTWMDPLAGIVGALVIANWSLGLLRDTGAILLDMTADPALAASMRRTVEAAGDEVRDLHLWRVGPGHLAAILSVATAREDAAGFYHARLAALPGLSHLTVEACAAPR